MNRETKQAILVLITGFIVRFFAAVVTTLTSLNPDSQADAVDFGHAAEAVANGIRAGQPFLYTSRAVELIQIISPFSLIATEPFWGLFLAPFWLIPGPSSFYARLGNAFIGAFAIYNVYIIARYYHSHHAGVVSVVPMLFYPSFVAIHSTLLREAIVLFGITTTARFLMIPSKHRSRWISYALAALALQVAVMHREVNIVIYLTAIVAALFVPIFKSRNPGRAGGISLMLSPIVASLSLPYLRRGVGYLARTRDIRGHGRTVYLLEVIPNSVFELIAFSWIGAAYFLYAPFPWMIQTLPDALVAIEGLVNIGFTIAAAWGVRFMWRKNSSATVGLLVGVFVATVLYGVGTVNYGTGMRHRQMFLWVIFLFGGIGISEHVRFLWPFKSAADTSSSLKQ